MKKPYKAKDAKEGTDRIIRVAEKLKPYFLKEEIKETERHIKEAVKLGRYDIKIGYISSEAYDYFKSNGYCVKRLPGAITIIRWD